MSLIKFVMQPTIHRFLVCVLLIILLSRAINFGRQCHFKIWLDCHKFKKFSCLIMRMSTKCQKNEKKMTINVIQHDDIYGCFTMEHFRLRQRMTLTTKIYCSRMCIMILIKLDNMTTYYVVLN
jgi:hypothetical protein